MTHRVLTIIGVAGLLLMAWPDGGRVISPSPSPAIALAGPSRIGGTPMRPKSVSYSFAHGRVLHPRSLRLAMKIVSADRQTPSNSGTWSVGFQAKLLQYVDGFLKDGTAQLTSALYQANTTVNGTTVKNAVPPTFQQNKATANSYTLFVNRYGLCDCRNLPTLIYDASGGIPHRIYLGDLFHYLHPALPTAQKTLNGSWQTVLAVALTPRRPSEFVLTSRLLLQHGAWMVSSSARKRFQITLPAAQWLKEWGNAWPGGLPTANPVTATLSIGINSALTLGQADGIAVPPPGAKEKRLGKGESVKPLYYCTTCTGYSMPLDGTLTLDISYTQDGIPLRTINQMEHLTTGIASS